MKKNPTLDDIDDMMYFLEQLFVASKRQEEELLSSRTPLCKEENSIKDMILRGKRSAESEA